MFSHTLLSTRLGGNGRTESAGGGAAEVACSARVAGSSGAGSAGAAEAMPCAESVQAAGSVQPSYSGVLQLWVRLVALWQFFLTRGLAAAVRKSTALVSNEAGMSTIEYAMGSLAAAALAGVLYAVIKGGAVVDAIEGIITDALSNSPS